MKKLYRLLDRILDPPPKEIRRERDKSLVPLYYDSQSEDYKRYKHVCYQNLVLKSLLAFLLGLLFSRSSIPHCPALNSIPSPFQFK